ncbi:MAG: chemotaxis protein CheW [Gemmataceae bacterium]
MSASQATRQIYTFYLDRHIFGVPVTCVQEILRLQMLTRVPRSASVVAGLVNLRGHIVTALDVRARLHLPPRPEQLCPMNVVVHTSAGPVSLLVDRTGDVLDCDPAQCEPVPDTVDAGLRPLFTGVLKLPDRLVLLVDVERVVTLPERVGAT